MELGHPGESVRIAVTGSAGTGKTTLVDALAKEHGLPVVPEGMRDHLERTGVDLHDLTPQELRELVQTLWRERQVREQEPTWISDRCSVDFGAYRLLYRFDHLRGADTVGFMTLFR